jgi:hypothetical protein
MLLLLLFIVAGSFAAWQYIGHDRENRHQVNLQITWH